MKENERITELLEYIVFDVNDLKQFIEEKNDYIKPLIDVIIENLKELKKEV